MPSQGKHMTLHEVIRTIAPILTTSRHIHAMWLEGSWVTGANTDESDIDVWLDVDDGCFDVAIAEFRAALETVGDIDSETARGVYCNHPRLRKHVFHLSGFPPAQRIELDLQEHSRNFEFIPGEHVIEVLFDKDSTIRWRA